MSAPDKRMVKITVSDPSGQSDPQHKAYEMGQLGQAIGPTAAENVEKSFSPDGTEWREGSQTEISSEDATYMPVGRGMIVQYGHNIPKEMKKLLKPYLGKKGAQVQYGDIMFSDVDKGNEELKSLQKDLKYYKEELGKDEIKVSDIVGDGSLKNKLPLVSTISEKVRMDIANYKKAVQTVDKQGIPEPPKLGNAPRSVHKKKMEEYKKQLNQKTADRVPAEANPSYKVDDLIREAEKSTKNPYIDIPQEMIDDYRKNGFSRYNLELPTGPNSRPKHGGNADTKSIFDLPEENRRQAFYRSFVDRFNNMKRLEENVEAAADPSRVRKPKSPYRALELYPGRADEAMEKINRVSDASIKAMVKNDISMQEMNDFLYAQHAPERNKKKAEENDGVQGLSGMTDEEAAAIMMNFEENGKKAKMEKIFKMLQKERARLDKEMVQHNVRMPNTQENFDEAYEYYVPLKGTSNPLENSEKGKRSKGYQSKDNAKRAAGRTSKATQNIMASYISDMAGHAVQIEKAKVGKVLLDYMRDNPNESFWQVDPPRTRKQFVDGEWVERPDPYRQGEPNVFSVQEDGQTRNIVFHTPEGQKLAQSLNGMDQESSNKVLQTMGKLNSWLGAVLTSYNPPFVISNALRDAQTAIYNIGVEKDIKTATKTTKGAPAAMQAIYRDQRGRFSGKWGEYWQELQEAGGKTGFAAVPSVEQKLEEFEKAYAGETATLTKAPATKIKKMAKDFLELIEDMNTSVENALRLSYYRTLREQGVSKQEAASEAKNLTVNFNRKGQYGGDINKLFLFFNAAVQGTDRLAQSYMKNPKKFAGLSATLASIGFTLGAWNQLMGGEDEDSGVTYWEKQPDFYKSSNFMVMIPGGKGKHIRIPMPYGHNALVSVGTRMADMVFNPRSNRTDQAFGMVNDAVGAANPLGSSGSIANMITPTAGDMMIELATNKNFAGNPIYREPSPLARAPLPNSEMGFKKTSPIFKGLSKAVNKATGGDSEISGKVDLNPDVLEHIYETATGGTGKFFKNVYETIHRGAKGEFIPEKTPFLSKVYGGDNQYYDQSQFYNSGEKVMKKIRQRGRQPVNRAKKKGYKAHFGVDGLTPEKTKEITMEAEELAKGSHGYVVLESLYNRLKSGALPRMRKGRTPKAEQAIIMQFFNKVKNSILPLQEKLDKIKDPNSPRAEKLRKAIDQVVKNEEKRLREKYAK